MLESEARFLWAHWVLARNSVVINIRSLAGRPTGVALSGKRSRIRLRARAMVTMNANIKSVQSCRERISVADIQASVTLSTISSPVTYYFLSPLRFTKLLQRIVSWSDLRLTANVIHIGWDISSILDLAVLRKAVNDLPVSDAGDACSLLRRCCSDLAFIRLALRSSICFVKHW